MSNELLFYKFPPQFSEVQVAVIEILGTSQQWSLLIKVAVFWLIDPS